MMGISSLQLVKESFGKGEDSTSDKNNAGPEATSLSLFTLFCFHPPYKRKFNQKPRSEGEFHFVNLEACFVTSIRPVCRRQDLIPIPMQRLLFADDGFCPYCEASGRQKATDRVNPGHTDRLQLLSCQRY